jgi:hypothetical protein
MPREDQRKRADLPRGDLERAPGRRAGGPRNAADGPAQ